MEEADLFMECEEEELEPWQQMNRDELFDSPDTDESMPMGAVTPPVSKPVVFSSISSVSTNMNTVPLFTNPCKFLSLSEAHSHWFIVSDNLSLSKMF